MESIMDRKPLLWIVAVVVALIAGWQLASAQGEKEKAVQKWEYKLYYSPEKDGLNALGTEGWELVCVVANGKEQPYACLKRPK
jgi:hypothetical protein